MSRPRKNLGDRPPCPKCGAGSENILSRSPYWMCKVCSHQWTKVAPVKSKEIDVFSLGSQKTMSLPLNPARVVQTQTDKTIVALFDAHLDPLETINSSFILAKQFTIDMQPDIIVLGGDWGDFSSLSAWDQKKNLLMEGKRYLLEIEMYKMHLRELRDKCPNSKMIFLCGNHEYRVARYLEDHANMEGLLDVEKDLEIGQMDMQWVPFNKIIQIGKLSFLHGIFYNKYFARSTLESIGGSCIFGHAHKSQTYTQRLHMDQQPNIACGIGCLNSLDPGWKRGMPTNFVNSFAYIDIRDDGGFNIHELIVIRDQFSFGGKTWRVE